MQIKFSFFAALIFLLTMLSCNYTPPPFDPMLAKKNVAEQFDRLQKDGELTEEQAESIFSYLAADIDAFAQNPGITDEEIYKMAFTSLTAFDSIKMTQEIFIPMLSAYQNLESFHILRNMSLHDLKNFTPGSRKSLTADLWEWFNAQQTQEDKFDALRKRAQNGMKAYSNEWQDTDSASLQAIGQRVLADIERIQYDTTLTSQQIQEIINNMLDSCAGDYNNASNFIGIYSSLAEMKELEMHDTFDKWYNDNYQVVNPYESLTGEEFRNDTEKRIEAIYQAGLVGKADYNIMRKTILPDIDFFNDSTNLPSKLEKRVKQSLSTLGVLQLDTEDREFVAGTYYELSRRREIDIADLLNEWLYGKELMELEKKMRQNKNTGD